MKHISNIKSFRKAGILVMMISLFVVVLSCTEDTDFNLGPVLPSSSDGIQNLDEEGIDCGGTNAPNPCPSCTDGIQNQDEEDVDCGGPCTNECPELTPRAQALLSQGLPRFFTFEAGDLSSGLNLRPRTTNADGSPYGQGVIPTFGVADPAGSDDLVTQIVRPENGPFGGFEDLKFQPQDAVIDFSEYNKFKIDVFIPSTNDFSGALTPMVELILHDDDPEFFTRWTVISQSVADTDFDSWVTLEFDGSSAVAAGSGTLLPDNTTYTIFTLRLGGSGHGESGVFFVKDFVPFK